MLKQVFKRHIPRSSRIIQHSSDTAATRSYSTRVVTETTAARRQSINHKLTDQSVQPDFLSITCMKRNLFVAVTPARRATVDLKKNALLFLCGLSPCRRAAVV
ncbi:hypothetical protein RCIA131 [Methanocella arvoryzae MRE50]|uniref:Uncharacterized protein n=1 Tax=Methanocella arvoryzae (strain DSM 22066 / NBRC 105507 / MRE50) TaxID=351160 RepID=Q0W458_METAR|nr:hypothetical protein RCIA131 [Methanocella arvoryzae MRE50]